MAQYEDSYARDSAASGAVRGISGWALGYIALASVLMILSGSFHFLMGLAGVVHEEFYVIRDGYDLKMDVTVWGWINLIGGMIVLFAGALLLTGILWARITCIAVATLSTIWSFYSIPYHPAWSILVIALNMGVIWALTTHGRDLEEI